MGSPLDLWSRGGQRRAPRKLWVWCCMCTGRATSSAVVGSRAVAHLVMKEPIPEEGARALWNIQKALSSEGITTALDEVSREVRQLKHAQETERVREGLDLIASIARYKLDVRPSHWRMP